MRTLYVVCVAMGRAALPKVGSERWDVPVEVPDASGESYERAGDEGRRRYCERFGVSEAYQFGVY